MYEAAHNQPFVITDAMGNAACYRYNHRDRKTAEWGTAIQPACFGYGDADRMTSLTTFLATEENIATAPGDREDCDTTTWSYHDATGLLLAPPYGDSTSARSYTYNHLEQMVQVVGDANIARGNDEKVNKILKSCIEK